jgi:hypothetical protein
MFLTHAVCYLLLSWEHELDLFLLYLSLFQHVPDPGLPVDGHGTRTESAYLQIPVSACS